MSKVNYFQRYSTKENTVTNSTLQLFAQINHYSPHKLDSLLSTLLDVPLNIGIEIMQQGRGAESVPDGLVLQRSFKLVIEAKVDAPVDISQIVRHCATFGTEEQKVLILLTIAPISKSLNEQITNQMDGKFSSIKFCNVTYREICEALKDLFKEHEERIKSIADDYQSYCWDVGLMDDAEFLMRVVPTGVSFNLNKKYSMYFDPADRGYSQHAFLGFYIRKAVQAMIKIKSIFEVHWDGKADFRRTHVWGEDTAEFDEKIKAMIVEAKHECGYDIATNHKFFCGTETFETNFVKRSPNGIMGARMKDLREFGVSDMSDVTRIAEGLRRIEWS